MTWTWTDPGPPNPEFERPADPESLGRVAAAMERRGFTVRISESGAQARELVLGMIPDGSEVHAANSETLRVLGLTSIIDESGRYDAVRLKVRALDRQTHAREIRKLRAAPDVVVGSAQAITDDGVILVASGTGSQLSAYAYGAGSVILVVGHQKLVRDVDEGLRRIREYCLPKEHQRVRSLGESGSVQSETLLMHFDPRHRTRVVFVPDALGF